MTDYISAYEYEKNVNPTLAKIPIKKKNINECDYGITIIDNSELYNIDFFATTPNLLASFIKLEPGKCINLSDCFSTSNLFFVIKNNALFTIDDKNISVNEGDILIAPYFTNMNIQNIDNEDLQIYYVNDSPLLNYLGAKPQHKIFETSIYSKAFLTENLNNLSDPNNNRKGILLSNIDTEKLGINTITPVMWALYNELPPNTVQKPHKHNSVALDLCISCSDSENIFTLVGDELDENGNILNPIKINWKESEMFITPPGLWHSHNNTGKTFAYILPIQDAGLLLYQRILGIVLK